MPFRKFNISRAVEAALLLVVTGLAYLPNLLQATIYRDDWYYAMDRLIGGPGVFQAMFSIDRPARGPFFEIYYQLFGITPLSYHLTSFLWRLLGGLAALWLFNLLWPKQHRAALFMALLFCLFPGYMRWMEGFEDQPRIASLFLEVLSFALTLKALNSVRTIPKIAAWIGAIITGWMYLALVDFGIGMEAFRVLCIFVWIGQNQSYGTFIKRCVQTVRSWAIAALAPAGYLFWKLFIFHNERPATDISRQLGVFISSPLTTGSVWIIRFLQSTADVALLSWMTPLLQNFFGLRLRELFTGMFLALLAVVCIILVQNYLNNRKVEGLENEENKPGAAWQTEATWVGLIGTGLGVLPVVMANRYVDFQSYSHYALPASLAAAVFIVGLIHSVNSSRIRLTVILTLVVIAMFAHFAYSTQVVNEERTISAFWQQVAWRAPNIQPGTTLFVNYPGINFGDNNDAVDGPANFIYYPERTNQIPVTYPLYALPQISSTTNDVLLGKNRSDGYRTHIATVNFNQFLVMSQPASSDCIHAIDPRWPLYASNESDQVMVIGGHSNINSILAGQNSPRLSATMFGPEPAHKWCYYFEKAELALQTGDWLAAANLGSDAGKAGLHPEDPIEWIPYLQAYAVLGDAPSFSATAHRTNGDPHAKLEACSILTGMTKSGLITSPLIETQMNNLLCSGE
jgi:hypothetical protein